MYNCDEKRSRSCKLLNSPGVKLPKGLFRSRVDEGDPAKPDFPNQRCPKQLKRRKDEKEGESSVSEPRTAPVVHEDMNDTDVLVGIMNYNSGSESGETREVVVPLESEQGQDESGPIFVESSDCDEFPEKHEELPFKDPEELKAPLDAVREARARIHQISLGSRSDDPEAKADLEALKAAYDKSVNTFVESLVKIYSEKPIPECYVEEKLFEEDHALVKMCRVCFQTFSISCLVEQVCARCFVCRGCLKECEKAKGNQEWNDSLCFFCRAKKERNFFREIDTEGNETVVVP